MENRINPALEFVMTNVWAIMVALVAFGALIYFGVLNPGSFIPVENNSLEINCSTSLRIVPLASSCRDIRRLLNEGHSYMFITELDTTCSDENQNKYREIKSGDLMDAYMLNCIS